MKPRVSVAALVFCLSFSSVADAQLFPRIFGSKSSEKNAPAKSVQPDPRRMIEVEVEVAWLADPVTFPYYLEAHSNGTQLEVRGYVPNKAVRDHAMRIAQVYASMPVADAMKEHPSLLVRPSQMSAQQLHASVMSSLRVALPKHHQNLKAQCSSDGKVYVVGAVMSYEEKLAVSHALRRLHGCTSVQNLTTLPGPVAQGPTKDRTPIVNTSNSSQKPVVAVDNKTKPFWPFGKAPKTKQSEEPPLNDQRMPEPRWQGAGDVKKPGPNGPILIPTGPEPRNEVPKVEPSAPTPTGAQLKKRILSVFPHVKGVDIQFRSARDVLITLEIANEKDLSATAERVFALPELQSLQAELQFKIGE